VSLLILDGRSGGQRRRRLLPVVGGAGGPLPGLQLLAPSHDLLPGQDLGKCGAHAPFVGRKKLPATTVFVVLLKV
jgi:hypothetical protein